jgi:hypothetical protein
LAHTIAFASIGGVAHRFDNEPPASKVFGTICHALYRFVQQTSLDASGGSSSSSSNAASLLWRLHSGKSKGLALLAETEAPTYDDLYPVSLSIDALVNIVHNIASLARLEETQRNQLIGDEKKQDDLRSKKHIQLSSSHCIVLSGLIAWSVVYQ